jgi:hypothetical protein
MVTLIVSWVTLSASRVTLSASWVTLSASWVMCPVQHETPAFEVVVTWTVTAGGSPRSPPRSGCVSRGLSRKRSKNR